MTEPVPQQARTVFEALGFARGLRQRGDLGAASSVLDAALAQAPLQVPATVVVSAQVGWLHLERAAICESKGELLAADEHGLRALSCFEQASDRGGQATACLVLGDLSGQTGAPGPARAWWERAVSLADNVGNTALAARGLASLAAQDLAAGGITIAHQSIAEAEERVEAGLDALVATQEAELHLEAGRQGDAARAALTMVRCREAIRGGSWSEARLLLGSVAQAARDLGSVELYLAALRLDADVARRSGDPRSAVEALTLARGAADAVGLQRDVALLDAELVLAHADNESWSEGFEVQGREPAEIIAVQPAVHAARLEGFAVLSLHGGNYAAAERALSEAAESRQQAGDVAGAARARALLATSLRAQGRLEQAWQTAEEAVTAAQRCGRASTVVDAGLTRLQVLLARHDPRAVELADELLALADEGASAGHRAILHDGAAAACLQAGKLDAALVHAEAGRKLAGKQPLVRLPARLEARKAQVALAAGRAQDALHGAQQAAELAGEARDPDARIRALHVAGGALLALGRHDEGILGLGHAMTEAMTHGRLELAAESGHDLANGQLRIGRLREARHVFAQVIEHASRSGARTLHARALRGEAACRRAGGDLDGALKALQRVRDVGDAVESAMAVIDSARLQVESGLNQEALTSLEGLEEAGAGRLSAAGLGEARMVRARALLGSGRKEEAAPALRAAVKAQRQGDERSLGAALFMLGQVEGMLGQGEACGEHLAEALIITARLGLPEQHAIRTVIERIQAQADGGAA